VLTTRVRLSAETVLSAYRAAARRLRRASCPGRSQALRSGESGYVERRRDPADRRRHIVEITPAGLTALEEAERRLETLEDEVLGNLSQGERVELHSLLSKALAEPDAD
jgi:hypothetical protein